jgi:hypothetical protein
MGATLVVAYALVPSRSGELVIDEAGAAIVREVFARYVAGETPRAIAADLNRRGVRPPRGARWNASTLNGNRGRGHGFLLNRLYCRSDRLEQVALGQGSGDRPPCHARQFGGRASSNRCAPFADL